MGHSKTLLSIKTEIALDLINQQNKQHEAIELVNELFKILEIHISSFQTFFKTSDDKLNRTKQEWVICFQQNNLQKNDVLRGIEKIRATRGLKYMISPTDFIDLCKVTHLDIGAPVLEIAFQEACDHAHPATWSSHWSHEAVKEAYKRTGNSKFLIGQREKTLIVFEAHYANACNDFALGRIAPQIPHKKPFSSSDSNRPERFGKHKMARPGVMKIYENVRSTEECFAICEKLTGKGTTRLHNLIQNLEKNYKREGLI